jgi:outer membrane protein
VRALVTPLVVLAVLTATVDASAQRARQGTRQERPRGVSREMSSLTLDALRTPGGMTLEAAVERALATSPALSEARANASAASADATAAWLPMLPHIDATARYMRVNGTNAPLSTALQGDGSLNSALAGVDDPDAQRILGALVDTPFPIPENQMSVVLTASLPLSEILLTILPSFLAADDLAEARAHEVAAAHNSVVLRTTESYYGYVRAAGALAVARAALEDASESRRQVEAAARAGALSGVDLRAAEAHEGNARVLFERSRAALAIAEASLRASLSLPEGRALRVGEDLTTPLPPHRASLPDLVQRAMDERPEIRALSDVISARDHAAGAAAGARWPQLVAIANYEMGNPNSRLVPAVEEWRSTWAVGAAVRWSPTEALIANARYDQASAQRDASRAALDAARNAIRVEVTAAYREEQAARASLDAAQLTVEAAEAAYRGRSAQLRAGGAVTGDLLDANADLARARLSLVDAAVGVRVARARLERATGGAPLGR